MAEVNNSVGTWWRDLPRNPGGVRDDRVRPPKPRQIGTLGEQKVMFALRAALEQRYRERRQAPRRAREPGLERDRGGRVFVYVPNDRGQIPQTPHGEQELRVVQQNEIHTWVQRTDLPARGTDRLRPPAADCSRHVDRGH